MRHKVLVVAAHPDDEVLGLGGTLLKHKAHKDKIYILILGDGETSRSNGRKNITKRAKIAELVAKKLHARDIQQLQLPDNQFDTLSLLSLSQIVEKHIQRFKPDTVYTHSIVDLNIDHRRTHEAVMTACRPQGGNSVKKISCFETPSSTEWHLRNANNHFLPQEYMTITDYIDEKLQLVKLYASELRPYPHPRSLFGIKLLAQYRGMQVGVQFAEAFEIIRNIV